MVQGQTQRHVSSTQMNQESSRSHLIMSVIIEATNLQTQNVTRGKLSFVDLAGSERCAQFCLCNINAFSAFMYMSSCYTRVR